MGLGIAVISLVIYAWNHRTKVVFLSAATILVASQAVVGGLFLCIKALMPINCSFTAPEKLYAIIGGMAVVWNATLSLKTITKPKELGKA